MKRRIERKIYKRAKEKLNICRQKNDKRDYLEQLKEEPFILSGIERKIFIKKQKEYCLITDTIIKELKEKNEW